MTIKKIKEKLPNIRVKINNRIYTGILSGKKNKFATISIFIDCFPEYVNYEFSWEAIARSINKDTFLIGD